MCFAVCAKLARKCVLMLNQVRKQISSCLFLSLCHIFASVMGVGNAAASVYDVIARQKDFNNSAL